MNVFPVRVGTKAPAIRGWAEGAKPLEQWQADWPGHSRWGAPAGEANGWWVLDVDPRHGGLASYEALEERYGLLPPTYTVQTPSGGLHYYWRWVSACALISNTAGKLGPGLDIRAEGGMVLVPPTEGYTPLTNCEPVEAPSWLLALLLPAPRASAGVQAHGNGEEPIRNPQGWGAGAIASAILEIRSAPLGTRDATMNRNAYGLGRVVVACGLDRDKVVDLLVSTAIEAGYDAHKALDCCQRAVDAGMQNPREVAAAIAPAAAPALAASGVVDANQAGAGGQLRPMPPKPVGQEPLPPEPGKQSPEAMAKYGKALAEWKRRRADYDDWNRALRQALDARLVVVLYEQSRVLYERMGLRRVALLGTMHQQAGAVKRIGEDVGLLVPTGTAVSKVEDYLTTARPLTKCPTLWDTGDGLYRWEAPPVAEGPTPTWDAILARISDPVAFLAHVWSAFEPRFEGRQVLWLQGDGNDGKSILFTSIFEGAGVPFAAVNDDDLQRASQFLFSSIWDKPVVQIGDSKSVNLMMLGVVHRLTGRDYLGVEYKHGQRFNAKYQGVVWVASNQRPQIEHNRSNLSRLSFLTISPGEWVDNLRAKLRSEVPHLLARAREAYLGACPDHFYIRLNEHSRELLGEATAADGEKHAATLHTTGLRIEGDDFVSRKEIQVRLGRNGEEAGKTASFYKWLERQPGVRAFKLGDGTRGFRGLKS